MKSWFKQAEIEKEALKILRKQKTIGDGIPPSNVTRSHTSKFNDTPIECVLSLKVSSNCTQNTLLWSAVSAWVLYAYFQVMSSTQNTHLQK